MENRRADDGIFFKVKNRFEKIKFEDIIWVQAKDIYSVIKTKDARFLVSHTLRDIDEKLSQYHSFLRVHRSYIVNLKKISAIEDGNLLVESEYIPVGQSYKEVLMQNLLFM